MAIYGNNPRAYFDFIIEHSVEEAFNNINNLDMGQLIQFKIDQNNLDSTSQYFSTNLTLHLKVFKVCWYDGNDDNNKPKNGDLYQLEITSPQKFFQLVEFPPPTQILETIVNEYIWCLDGGAMINNES